MEKFLSLLTLVLVIVSSMWSVKPSDEETSKPLLHPSVKIAIVAAITAGFTALYLSSIVNAMVAVLQLATAILRYQILSR